ncbi:MAG: hypothetical protein LBV71_13130 [Prevotella sp.]|jgi:hypothetical protein|nr:hypothetical protein [Prevotella sp.]
MKKYLFLILVSGLLFSCDKEETEADLIKRYESELTGTWIPFKYDYPEEGEYILIFHPDKTLTYHVLYGYNFDTDKYYAMRADNKHMHSGFNVRVEKNMYGSSEVFEICYEYKYISNGKETIGTNRLSIDRISKDVLLYHVSDYPNKTYYHEKVSSEKVIIDK